MGRTERVLDARTLRQRERSWGEIAALLKCSREQARRAAVRDGIPRKMPPDELQRLRRAHVRAKWSALLAERAAARRAS